MKIFLSSVLLILSTNILAEYKGGVDVVIVRLNGTSAFVHVTPKPLLTCDYWGEELSFDYKSDTGKAYLSLLLTAKTTANKIDVWYTASTAPNTDQSNGCGTTTISTLTGVRLK